MLGLFGEAGTLLSSLKKKQRDGRAYVKYRDDIIDDLGDILWYLSNIASKNEVSLPSLAIKADESKQSWTQTKIKNLTFGQFLPQISSDESAESPSFEKSLVSLGASVGLLLNDFQESEFHSDKSRLSSRRKTPASLHQRLAPQVFKLGDWFLRVG